MKLALLFLLVTVADCNDLPGTAQAPSNQQPPGPPTGGNTSGEKQPSTGNKTNGEKQPSTGNKTNGEKQHSNGNETNGEKQPSTGNKTNEQPSTGNKTNGVVPTNPGGPSIPPAVPMNSTGALYTLPFRSVALTKAVLGSVELLLNCTLTALINNFTATANLFAGFLCANVTCVQRTADGANVNATVAAFLTKLSQLSGIKISKSSIPGGVATMATCIHLTILSCLASNPALVALVIATCPSAGLFYTGSNGTPVMPGPQQAGGP